VASAPAPPTAHNLTAPQKLCYCPACSMQATSPALLLCCAKERQPPQLERLQPQQHGERGISLCQPQRVGRPLSPIVRSPYFAAAAACTRRIPGSEE